MCIGQQFNEPMYQSTKILKKMEVAGHVNPPVSQRRGLYLHPTKMMEPSVL